MPIFGSHRARADEHNSRAETERAKAHENEVNGNGGRSAFGRKRNSMPASTSPARSGSILARFREHPSLDKDLSTDPSIKAAREMVTSAEHAERDADKALELARKAVRQARQHVKELEAAALEEARRARLKQKEAKTIRKGADRLGRHDHT